MHSTESRFVIRPSNILFGGVYVCMFTPGILQAGEVKGLIVLKQVPVLGGDPLYSYSFQPKTLLSCKVRPAVSR